MQMFRAHLDFGPHAPGHHLNKPYPVSRLTDARDPRPRDDRRLFLPLRKPARSFEFDVHARERLAVPVIHSHTPVMMPAAAIFAQLRWFSLGHRQPSSHAQLQESYRRLSSGEYVGQPQPRNRHCNAHPAAPGSSTSSLVSPVFRASLVQTG